MISYTCIIRRDIMCSLDIHKESDGAGCRCQVKNSVGVRNPLGFGRYFDVAWRKVPYAEA